MRDEKMINLKIKKNNICNLLIFLIAIILATMAVSAADEIVLETNRINYYGSENHVVTVTNNGASTDTLTFNLPAGWSYISGTGGCSNIPPITCTLNSGDSGSFTIQSNGAATEYSVDTVSIQSSSQGYTGNDVLFLRIDDNEIFHTLVEYGRGRGNYFFDTLGVKISEACTYIPDNTKIELSFLHKVHPIKQYFEFGDAIARNITFSCTYPDNSMIRQHLTSSITRSGGLWDVDYSISELIGSWERMGYLSLHFSETDYDVDDTITINCTDVSYYLEKAGGYIYIPEDSFTLTFRDREPFTASASTSDTIGQGTQEVLVSYTITNNEVYDVNNVIIEISAPEFGTFIGVRGELWGSSQDIYRLERTSIPAGGSTTIDLIVRFDTTNASGITELDLSEGITVNYLTCWEANAYNPIPYSQFITLTDTATVDLGTTTEIISVQDRLNELFDIINVINDTTKLNNQTLHQVLVIVEEINVTTQNINSNITNIVIPSLSTINDTINRIETLSIEIIELLNCSNDQTDSVCNKLNTIINNTDSLESEILNTQDMVINMNDTMNYRFDLVDANITEIRELIGNVSGEISDVIDLLDCTNSSDDTVCNKLDNLEIFITQVNNTVNEIHVLTTEINSTTHANNVLLETINITTNNILSNTESLNDSINNLALDLQNLVNCSFNPTSPLCIRLDNMNDTIVAIWNLSNVINETTTTIQFNLEDNMTMVMERFDYIDANITVLRDDIAVVHDLVNCSVGVTLDDSICYELYLMNITLDEINRTTHYVSDVVTFINETRWGNMTAQELYDLMNSTSQSSEELLYKVTTMQEFNAELVFLVTDAFGMQNSARSDINTGSYNQAAHKLTEANVRLDQATQKLIEIQKETQPIGVDSPSLIRSNFSNWKIWIIVVGGMLLLAMLFVKVPVKNNKFD
jgi:hypothetical protein